jgi:hypothetical protein
MTAGDFEQTADVSQYGAQLRANWLAGLQAHADMAEQAALAAHGQSEARQQVQVGQAGLFGHMTPEDRGAAVAARTATVGGEWGRARPLERLGGVLDPADYGCAPAPARADMRSTAAPPGYMRDGNPLDKINRGQR